MTRLKWLAICTLLLSPAGLLAQQLSLGNITGTVTDSSGAAVPGAKVTAHNAGTNLEQSATTQQSGFYQIANLPIGTYTVSVSKEGFQTEEHTEVLVQANRSSTVNGILRPGAVSEKVEVTATPLLNQVDTTNGYILDELTIQNTPLGTGSFTQLAILSPGVNADFLNGSGTNAGLGNQSIFANGQRDTSNSFSFNGVNSNNVFNGKSSSQVSGSRFLLNTNENFLAGGDIQTSTSVYDAIGQGLPTPPPETIQELRVNSSMYDASQGAHSGAQIEIITKSGANDFHGSAYGYYQTSDWNAAPFFRNADSSIPSNQKVPDLERKNIGFTLGGPVVKDKLFFFGSYQGTRVEDELNSISRATVPLHLTGDRSAAALAQVAQIDFETTVAPSQISAPALALLQAKTPDGKYFIPSPTITDPNLAGNLGYDALLQAPPAKFSADQVNGNLDYIPSSRDRLAGKYYYQNDPSTSPFAVSALAGFGQSLQAGAHVFSLDNTTILSPNLTWEQRVGFIRQRAYGGTQQSFTPSGIGINLFNSNRFPGITINNADNNTFNSLAFGPASNFANAGVYQNQLEGASNLGWVIGRHSVSVGFNWDYVQLNVINRNNDAASLTFNDYPSFLTGTLRTGAGNSVLFTGTSNRYYRANTAGAFAQDNIKVKTNLTVNLGVRYDYDGPLSEKYGRLSNFYADRYQYDAATDTIINSGLVIAGNNKAFHTPGTSNSTMRQNQGGFAPRLGVVWSPAFLKNFVVRAGYGLYLDRGQFFTEFSPSAGNGYNGPFGVTLEPPFVVPVLSTSNDTFANPFGTTPPPPPPGDAASFSALLPNIGQLRSGNFPAGNQFGPFLFGGYDPKNKLPYSQNWTVDFQWQPVNSVVLDLAYVGNHGSNLTIPIPFNQSGVATPQHPIHGEIYSYGYNVTTDEPVFSSTGGNTDLRTPYVGYSPNSVFYRAVGISNYNALQFQVRKRLSRGLQVNASYTWSHSLDEQSGLGLFYNGNDPLHPGTGYSSSDFDRTHVITINYLYQFPHFARDKSFLSYLANGWGVSGTTIAQSGQPYNVYDFTGAVASLYYSSNDFITNPIVPIAPGSTVGSAQLQGTTGVNAGKPVLSYKAFTIPTLEPGQKGVPPCGVDPNGNPACDTFETDFGNGGRNVFRGPFQTRFDASVFKEFRITERFQFRYGMDFFNIFNHPSFDTPNNDVRFYNFYNPPNLQNPPGGSLGMIQHTIGSPRFIQMSLRLTF